VNYSLDYFAAVFVVTLGALALAAYLGRRDKRKAETK
jgi:hypothetical protein